jgi:hypothetical protein
MKKYFCSSFISVMTLLLGCYQPPQSHERELTKEEIKEMSKRASERIREINRNAENKTVTSMAELVEDLSLYDIHPGYDLMSISARLIMELDDNLVKDKALNQLKRIFNKDFEYDTKLWNSWLQENKNYLYLSDKDNYFVIDEEAKAAGIPTEEYRKTYPWPTEPNKTDKSAKPPEANESNK